MNRFLMAWVAPRPTPPPVLPEASAPKSTDFKPSAQPVEPVSLDLETSQPATIDEEIELWKRTFNATVPESRPYPAPSPLCRVKLVFGGKQVGLTFVRHNCAGVNRFGQDAAEFPYVALNFTAWRQRPFDLTRVCWYRSPEEVGAACRIEIAFAPELEDQQTCASFSGGVNVELRLEARSRWVMWVGKDTLLRRRKDISTPYLDHARRCAEHFYGAPISGWREPSLAGKEQACLRT